MYIYNVYIYYYILYILYIYYVYIYIILCIYIYIILCIYIMSFPPKSIGELSHFRPKAPRRGRQSPPRLPVKAPAALPPRAAIWAHPPMWLSLSRNSLEISEDSDGDGLDSEFLAIRSHFQVWVYEILGCDVCFLCAAYVYIYIYIYIYICMCAWHCFCHVRCKSNSAWLLACFNARKNGSIGPTRNINRIIRFDSFFRCSYHRIFHILVLPTELVTITLWIRGSLW